MKTLAISLTLSAILFSSTAFASTAVSCAYKPKAGERVISRDVDTVQQGKPTKVQKCFLVTIQKPLPKKFKYGSVANLPDFETSRWNK